MRICAISDLHGYLPEIEECDILFICGDIVPIRMQNNIPQSMSWFKKEFIPWCINLPVKGIYMVAGNHDKFMEYNEENIKDCLTGTNIHILYNEYENIFDSDTGKVYIVFGSPNCHIFGNWAFMYSDEHNKKVYEKMSNEIDFLITHDAPYGRNDVLLQKECPWANGEHIGNIPLAEVIKEKKPKYHFTGHLHSTDHNLVDYDGTLTACVSLLDEFYNSKYPPLYIDIDK